MAKSWVVFTFLCLCISGEAAVSEKSSFLRIPAGSTLQFKTDLEIEPREKSIPLFKLVDDADVDGVADYEDWCPRTPAGSKVWTWKEVEAAKGPRNQIGCAGKPGEGWMYDAAKPDQVPSGYLLGCALSVRPSGDDRVLDKALVLTVLDSADPGLSDAERSDLTEPFSGPAIFLRSPGGTHFGLRCWSQRLHQQLVTDTWFITTTKELSAGTDTIENLRKHFDIQLAKPVPIP